MSLIHTERSHLLGLVVDDNSTITINGSMTYLAYLCNYWMKEELWQSWSLHGRIKAASRLGIPVEGVLPTTNHLEVLNRIIKKKYLPQWQRSGNRLRFDVLVFHLVRHILPYLYAQVRQRDNAAAWKAARFATAAGGVTPSRKHESGGTLTNNTSAPFFWFEEDIRRDGLATGILQGRQLLIIPSSHPTEVWATCATSSSNPDDPSHERYWLTYNLEGTATCTCPDWLKRGGACKHLRALRRHVRYQMEIRQVTCDDKFPASLQEAQDKHAVLGDQVDPPTQPVSVSLYPNGYANPTPPPTMVPSALPEVPLEMELGNVPTLLNSEIEIAAQMYSVDMGSDIDGPQDDAEGGGDTCHDDDMSQVVLPDRTRVELILKMG
jgi:SWIM zinc finger